ncbi:sigma-54-dependent transcriptional regulator [Sulfurivermis fontis]|uniref:sigma-54-dependent transcriptional regulator n=1 Tax=Sulfurivermis fontis TaxID=1972068 RepID=UPI000FD9F1E0|nr:sigma-54 dependent transcriptional regulator [Sulfurivermis fontis]
MSAAEPVLSVLLVEDEPDVAHTLKRVIESLGSYRVAVQLDARQLGQSLAGGLPDLVVTDLMMGESDGFEVIRQVKAVAPDLPVVVVSAYATLENAVEAVRVGAFDFLPKPFSPDSVELLLAKVRRELELRGRLAAMCRQAQAHDPYIAALKGGSPAMTGLRAWICRVRDTGASVLIEGETGTGKELVARAIHAGKGPFVAVNMASIPLELAESELFGHCKGAFSGATHERQGLLKEADGGVLFLDEVNALPPQLQAKLLRALQERRVRPVGADREVAVDFRLISASNQPLEPLLESGAFRRDLYHRLNVLQVRLPPLRERREDIPLLAGHFLEHYARAHGRPVRRLAEGFVTALQRYGWPGNVRELENVIEQAVILCPEGTQTLEAALLPPALRGSAPAPAAAIPAPALDGTLTLAEAERRHILQVVQQTGGNKAEAARTLDIDYKTLLRKLSQY